MLHILNGVNGDLIAAEAKYHKYCFATYVSKKTTLSLPKREALDSPHERAFQDLVFDLAAGIEQGRAYDMMSLLSKYQEIHSKFKNTLAKAFFHFDCLPSASRPL